ncbi:MAG: elongation factor G [Armatimonadota bacterium]|nr:elongation factor G [Armatimonadota bacterium]MDR7394736.1 elongation factor G [Armatimonadota bacterium]MDR7397476.1 elongation factor G [Armatimonadota bacterium]MDR7399808.1 elongation factor G [Armatimonadota bacterium]MDR7409455.1 elongation factor G [Armatimonadota bacterium]
MKTYPVERIRNVAVVGHGGVGKTSLVEALLFCAGATERMGRVDDGTATTDFDPEEVRRKITINAATAPLEWRDHKVNLIDTPGYPDFVGEAHAALRVADAALFVVDALSGVQVQTEKLWKVADQHGLPRLVVVNRLDRENAQFARAVESLQARFGAHVVPLQVPLGSETALRGVVDLVGMRAFTYEGGRAREAELPEDARDEALSWREKLLERAAESDDALLEKYLEQGELSEDELRGGLRAGVASGRVVPVVCAVATSGLGAQGVLDLVVDLVPSPADRPAEVSVDGQTLRPDPSGPLAALVFKTMADPYVGRLSYFRVYSGTLRSDSQVYNANKERAERVGQLYLLRGKQQIPVSEVPAGDLGAVAKLSETQTNDTLCSKDHPVRLRPVEFPRPAISMTVEPKSKQDEDKLGQALARLAEEDPTLHVEHDPESKKTILSGLGESHLEIVADRLRRKFHVEVQLGQPHVPYRETVRKKATAEGRYVKQTGGRGQYGVCTIEIEPLPRGTGYEFVDRIFGGAIPQQFRPSVDKGVRKAMEEGVLAGYPVVDVRVTLVDGKTHPVDSSDIAFQIAGSLAFKKAAEQAGVVLLEPIMNVSVTVPDDLVGDVIGDLNGKRGRIQGMEPNGDGTTTVRAQVPMAEMLRYASDLRSITGGRGFFEMSFSHYEEVPSHIAQKVVEEAAHRRQAAESH